MPRAPFALSRGGRRKGAFYVHQTVRRRGMDERMGGRRAIQHRGDVCRFRVARRAVRADRRGQGRLSGESRCTPANLRRH